jgi:seryl-tRNA synthetase
MTHYSIRPLDDLIASITTEVNEVIKQRELYLTDYDSYRRRIKACKEKIEKIQSTQPINQSKLEAEQQELNKLQNKHDNAESHYSEFNLKAKTLLKDSRRTILGYVEKHVVTSLTCQVPFVVRPPSLSHKRERLSFELLSSHSFLFTGRAISKYSWILQFHP